MTCDDARESLSAFLDEVLEPEERRRVEAHLAGCADCPRELERLRQTVALLRRVEPARAPVGFVDRVVAAARPRPWYRRVGDTLFVPLSAKLPAEAVALALVGLLAVYIFERVPEVQQAARPPASTGLLADRPADRDLVGAPSRAPGGAASARSQSAPLAERDAERRDSAGMVRGTEPASDAKTQRETAAPAAAPAPASPAEPAPAPPPASAPAPGPAAPSAVPSPSVAAGAPVAKTAPENMVGGRARLETGSLRQSPEAARLSAAKQAPSADVIARAAVKDRDAAERELAELITRVGGTETQRRRDDALTVVEALIPEPRYAEFAQGLAQIGSWRVEAERADLPARVHVILHLQ
ncbi:MAG TPA: zf-HC2 domain-containing protein [Candidatus Dormibacteraeota bacterium]|jgi:hypothetical protein|nr:zf-HC2 domain-containing protein [Candidatus Dormibacteraeota bacterium]